MSQPETKHFGFPHGYAEWLDREQSVWVRGRLSAYERGLVIEQTDVRVTRANEIPPRWEPRHRSFEIAWSGVTSFGVVSLNGSITIGTSSEMIVFFVTPVDDEDLTAWLEALGTRGILFTGVFGEKSEDVPDTNEQVIPTSALRNSLRASPVSQKVFGEVGNKLTPLLGEGEFILSIGEALWVQFGLKHGRDSGEGVLGITNQSVLFVLNRFDGAISVPLVEVRRCWKTFIVLPNFSEIHFLTSKADEISFYATKRMCKEILRLKLV